MERTHSPEASKAIRDLVADGKNEDALKNMPDAFILDLAKNQLHNKDHLLENEHIKDNVIYHGKAKPDNKTTSTNAKSGEKKLPEDTKPDGKKEGVKA